MPVDYEDSMAGSTDISGQPDPVRTPKQLAGDTNRKVGQNERRPKPSGQSGGGFGGMLGHLGQDIAGGLEGASNWLENQGFQQPKQNDYNPIDWGEEYARDAGAVWGMARDAYSALSGEYHGGVHSLFSGDDMRSRVLQSGADSAVAGAIPILGAKEQAQEEMSQLGALTGRQSQAQAQQEMGREREQAVQDAPGAAAEEATLALPGSAAGRAAQVAIPLGQSLLESTGHDDTDTALAWAAVGTVLSFGHIPAPLRKAVLNRLPGLGRVLQGVQAGQAQRQKVAQASLNAGKQAKLISDHIKTKLDAAASAPLRSGLQHLVERLPGEPELRDPSLPIKDLEGGTKGAAEEHLGALSDAVQEIHSRLWTTSDNPAEMTLRAIAGHARSLDVTMGNYFTSLKNLLGKVTPTREVEMMKAAEGDTDVYKALAPEEKVAVDSWRLLGGAMREASQDTRYAKNFVPNYVPRVNEEIPEVRKVGRPSKASVLARETRKHRAAVESVDESGTVQQHLLYPTVQAANDSIRQQRQEMVDRLLATNRQDPTQLLSTRRLPAALRQSAEAQEIRRLFSAGNVDEAKSRAIRLANDHFALKNERFLEAISRTAPYQAKAILSQRGINTLAETVIRGKHPDGSEVLRKAAVNTDRMKQRDIEELQRQGYERIEDGRFRGFVFDKNVASILKRYTEQDIQAPRALEALSKLNGQLLRVTMYSPHIHGFNIARRYEALALQHPIQVAKWMAQHKAMVPGQTDDVSRALRREFYQAGGLPPRGARGWQANFADSIGSALGDSGNHVHFGDEQTRTGKMLKALKAPVRPLEAYEDGFWRWVGDFGTMAFHVEKEAAKASGKSDAEARAWAARRANSWMGMTLPEDTNPMVQKLARLALFAPNWWKSMGELMVPIYKRSGIFETPQDAMRAVGSGLHTTGSMFGAMKMQTELMNHLLSGHGTDQNEPGHQDDVEIRNPAVLHGMQAAGLLPAGMDPDTGINPKTGARMYLRVGGQMEDVLQAAGMESGQPSRQVGPGLKVGPADIHFSPPEKPEDTWDGMMKFLAARQSPLAGTLAALGNVDLYATLTQGGTPRAVVKGTTPFQPSWAALAAATILAVPGGQNYLQSIQNGINQNGADTTSLFGTQVPKTLQDYTKSAGPAVARAALTGLLGINPPYASAQRTRGTPLSDEDYQKVKELTDSYNQKQAVLGANMFSGQQTPSRWLQQHRTNQSGHSAQMQGFFHNAPEYVNGSEGMAATYEGLYDEATGPDGTIDQVKLAELQAKFRSEHSPQELAAMQTVLRQADHRDPALALYHHVLDSADQWEAQWAQSQGLDINQLHAENSEYAKLQDAKSRTTFLRQHRELDRLKTAIQREFYRTPEGMMYALYRGENATVLRHLRGEFGTSTPQEAEADLEQQVKAQEQPAA